MSMGVDKDLVDISTPNELQPYETAYKMRLEDIDTLNFYNGLYTLRALNMALDSALGGGKSHIKYFEQPIIQEANKYSLLTQEEKDEIELRKMLANEEAWIARYKMSGLPATKV